MTQRASKSNRVRLIALLHQEGNYLFGAVFAVAELELHVFDRLVCQAASFLAYVGFAITIKEKRIVHFCEHGFL